MLEQRIYDMDEKIKSVVISVQNYRVMREIMPQMYRWNISDKQRIDLLEEAKRHAKHELLDGLEQFVHCELDEDRNIIEAQIWMPYVKDAVVKSLENIEKRLGVHLAERENTIRFLQKRIKYLDLPWWKKLWLWIQVRMRK